MDQQDVLAHPKVNTFISQVGLMSLQVTKFKLSLIIHMIFYTFYMYQVGLMSKKQSAYFSSAIFTSLSSINKPENQDRDVLEERGKKRNITN